MSKGTIIVLNGVSSSGKSTLAQHLTEAMPHYFPFRIDSYDDVIASMEDREGGRLIPVDTEYFYYKNAAMFANRGVHLILDQILHNEETRRHFYEILAGYKIILVGVHCAMDEVKKREQLRGDRGIGLALSQLDFVHRYETYDMEVNTSEQSIEECVEAIRSRCQAL